MRDSIELTLARLAFRQVAASRRALWAVVPAGIPVLLALLARVEGAEAMVEVFVNLYQSLVVAVLLPLLALVIGNAVFGNELEDGTIAYVVAKPVARWRVVVARTVTAGALTAAVLAPATLAAGWVSVGIADPDGLTLGFTAAVIAGSFLYCALFVALSLSTRRALVVGLGYVAVWEGILSGAVPGLRALSIRQYTLSFADAFSRAPAELFAARLTPGTAVWLAAAVALLATLYAVHRLGKLEIGEAH